MPTTGEPGAVRGPRSAGGRTPRSGTESRLSGSGARSGRPEWHRALRSRPDGPLRGGARGSPDGRPGRAFRRRPAGRCRRRVRLRGGVRRLRCVRGRSSPLPGAGARRRGAASGTGSGASGRDGSSAFGVGRRAVAQGSSGSGRSGVQRRCREVPAEERSLQVSDMRRFVVSTLGSQRDRGTRIRELGRGSAQGGRGRISVSGRLGADAPAPMGERAEPVYWYR